MGEQAPWGFGFCGEGGGMERSEDGKFCERWEGVDTPSTWPPHISDGKSNLTSALRL
jgi:hypothetical protein